LNILEIVRIEELCKEEQQKGYGKAKLIKLFPNKRSSKKIYLFKRNKIFRDLNQKPWNLPYCYCGPKENQTKKAITNDPPKKFTYLLGIIPPKFISSYSIYTSSLLPHLALKFYKQIMYYLPPQADNKNATSSGITPLFLISSKVLKA